jgi:hypothetical protein
MSEESAAGRKTDRDGRHDRIVDGLEKNFEECGGILRNCIASVERRGGYDDRDFRYLALFLKTSAQIAGVIARFETVKNRGSIPQ